jgi:hypothetical protein
LARLSGCRGSLPLAVALSLLLGCCVGAGRYSESACTTAMVAARARADAKSGQALASAYLPTIESCSSLEEWTQSATAAGLSVQEPTKFVARVCALADVHLQEKRLCQQTHGLVPFG